MDAEGAEGAERRKGKKSKEGDGMNRDSGIQLTDANLFPDETVLRGVLGAGYSVYLALLDGFEPRGLSLEWRYYRDGKAWLGKVQHKRRTIVWMSAWEGFVRATVYVAEKDVPGLRGLDLSPATKDALGAAKRVGKSLPCTFDVTGTTSLRELEAVMGYKMATGSRK